MELPNRNLTRNITGKGFPAGAFLFFQAQKHMIMKQLVISYPPKILYEIWLQAWVRRLEEKRDIREFPLAELM